MKTIDEFLLELSQMNVKLWNDGEHLCYKAPKGSLTPTLLTQLRERNAEILTFLNQTKAIIRSQSTSISSVPRNKNLPLSFAQQRLWFIDQLDSSSSAYNIPATYRLKGLINVTDLEQSLSKIIQRHEILRTIFPVIDGQPSQVIFQNTNLTLPIINLQELSPDQREAEVQRLALLEAQKLFNLAQGPLLRVKLLRLSEQEHILLLTVHHIVYDGWSHGVFMQELAALYEAFSTGIYLPLPEPPIQYVDFAHWQREWLQSEVLASQLSYWKQQLSGNLPVLQLPTDYLRPPVQTYPGAYQSLELSLDLAKALKALSQQEGVTLFMTLLAAFQILLFRYSGQEDIIVGTPIAGRNQVETEGLIGLFINSLAIRTNLSGNSSFRQLLSQVREVTLGAYEHQDLPLEKLIEELNPERNLSRSPLFQVMFVFQSTLRQPWKLPGLTITPLEVHNGTSKFDLTLDLKETSEGIKGGIEYNIDLFKSATITRMLGHFQILLKAIITNPEQRVEELPLLTEAEQQLLIEWNQTKIDYPIDQCIHQLFEAQVERTPDSIALVFEENHLTYRELNNRSNQLAYYLQQLGVKPDVIVGICLERSLEMVIAILAILKAGGAYLPLDPTYPKERLAFMIADAQVSVLLTQKHLVEALPQQQAQVICVGSDVPRLSTHQSQNPVSQVNPSHLAYLIYTSGSTGTPKGVLNTHLGLANRLVWMQDEYRLTASDRILQKTPFSFDVSVWEFLWPLLAGASLVVASPEGHRDSAYLGKIIATEQITTLHFVPSMLQVFLEQSRLEKCHSLKRVFCSGEALSLRLQERFFARIDAELHNLYGPTEAAIDVTYWSCQRKSERQFVPIGRPIANTQIYLLDRHLQPVPIGVTGELHIGGVGLARGYLKRQELTEEKFIANPFRKGERLYKTGDLARFHQDGTIEYLGRIDHQVKLRGFRIELGEIERSLLQYSGIRETIVTLREDVPGDKRLVSYVVLDGNVSCSPNDLQSFLKKQLPDYMVPSAFVVMDALPLTPNGKVDRRALPAPNRVCTHLEATFVAANTPIEEILTGIWAQILRLEQVSIHDNFFNLGGHSLLATQFVARVRQTFSVELPLRVLFETPTIAKLSSRLETIRWAMPTNANLSPILPTPRDKSLPLSFAQIRLWFLNQLEPGNFNYNIPAAYRLTGVLNLTALEQSLNEIIQRHSILGTSFPSVDGQPSQVISPSIALILPIIDLREHSETEGEAKTQQIATEESQQPFDLSTEPLFRVKLLRLAEESHVLLLNMHHIIFDGWSFNVFFRELAALYTAFSNSQLSPLLELPIQYADFAYWQREYLQGEVLESQLNYWKQQLSGSLPILQLPTDYPRPPVQTYPGAYQSLELSKNLTEALKLLSQQERVTLFMTLLAAFQTLLSRYSGQEDIITGTPIAGRNQVETEGLIGLFINSLAIRTNLAGNLSFRQLLSQVREVTLGAYEHQDLPLEKLIEELKPERDLSRSPLFQVMFAFQNTPSQPWKLPGLTITPLEVHSGTSKFDLTLDLKETSEGIKGGIEYNTDLFEAATIARMLGHFQTLLEGIVANPEQRLLDLPLLTAAEQHQLLVEWNNTQTDYPDKTCIHQLFETQVERTPNAIAAVFENEQLTYQQLNYRANQLAHHLQKLDVKPEVLVGICLERSLDLLVALLGILKSGGAYVPLDPIHPQERVTSVINNAEVAVLLTQEKFLNYFVGVQTKVVCIDKDWKNIQQEKNINLETEVTPSHLAYVIYTSGSTGKPKGVQIYHQSVVNFLQSMQVKPGLTDKDILLAVTTISFDIAALELYLPLIVGAKVIIINQDIASNGYELAALLTNSCATVMQATPATWHILLAADWQCSPHFKIICGGEALSYELAQKLLDKSASVWNLYGPTETTIWATTYQVTRAGLTNYRQYCSVPIGTPIANTQIYILDSHLQPAPIGVVGELYIGGTSLARGYHRLPDLTKEKFVSNPFSDPNSHLYKTGDLARYLPDGNIEFLGRIDNQVKIRGFRIELAEVEFTLAQHSALEQCALAVREDISGDKRLVAYIVPNQEQSFTVDELRRFLKQKLPNYMLPSAFILLDYLPLTPNGKIDHCSLPALDQTRQEPKENLIAPRDLLELQLTKIWEEVLSVKPIGIKDNFFHLGGHSLLAVRLFAQINKRFSKDLPLATLFQSPTVEELANIFRQKNYSATWSSLVPIQPKGSKPPLFCIHAAGGNVLGFSDLVRYLGTDQPVFGLQAQGLDGKQESFTKLEEIASHYVEEICALQPNEPYFLAGHSFGGYVALEMAHQLHAQGQKVALVILFDTKGTVFRPQPLSIPLQQKFSGHLSNLLQLNCLERLIYISHYATRKWQWQIYKLNKRIEHQINKIKCKFYLATGHPIPLSLREFSVVKAHTQAYHSYQMKNYPGRVILFRSLEQPAERYHDLGWSKLVSGELKIYDVPGHHGSLLREPHVKVLAEKLKACLDKAQ